ncbi:serine/threonine-protein kinase LMTK3-like isoform X1 [Felis catus]|uniref:serine/threonine-protein kinase LMTK3-like isoform X1 n=1 Tax=Felis catus TaxID=9685 RepID=UPI001D1A013A|nr:serine/threonine-protein kinase LMTK3-like isoform X1 [Felis catus]
MRNNEPRGPAAPRASQLGPSPSRPPVEAAPHWGPPPPAGHPLGTNLRPSAHTRGVEVKLSWAAPAPRRPLPPPRPAPSPHPDGPPTAQRGPERRPRRLLPAPAAETPLGPRRREAQVQYRKVGDQELHRKPRDVSCLGVPLWTHQVQGTLFTRAEGVDTLALPVARTSAQVKRAGSIQ